MNFSVYNNNLSNNYYNYSTNKNISFNGNHYKNQIKKAAPYIMSAIMGMSAIACSKQNCSQTDDFDGITVEYTSVSPLTRDSVMKPVYDMKKHLKPQNDFLQDTKFDIAHDFAEIEENEHFKKFLKNNKARNSLKGTSFYSDGILQKHIALQEIAHTNSYPEMRQTLMHEVGHQFDNYFGHEHNADFAKKWDSLVASKPVPYDFLTVTRPEQELDIEYNYNNSLSDKARFQKALMIDLKNILRMKRYHEPMPDNLNDYIGRFDMYNLTTDNIDRENSLRAEIYAQLFSYATGQDDGKKDMFIKCFSNCYDVVNQDIERFLDKKLSK